jgi:DNA mismatch repair protein MutL
MGFRGEALASIGSVAHARICTRTHDSDAAYEILNRGGTISDPQAAAGNVGTTIEIRNLFFNVPARRKFLKGTQTEYGHISETLLKLALPHPHIAFVLTHNGRKALELLPTSPEERWLAAWPNEFREQRLPIDARDAELRLRGIIGLPELARPTPKYQYLYLNGRSIRDKFIQHALREAFRGLTEPGRHPAAVLLLDIPPGDVDVNVHPTKSEVRFRDGGRIHGLVLSAVRERLLGSDLTPQAMPRAMSDDADAPGRVDMRQRLAAFFQQMPPSVADPTESGLGAAPPSAATQPQVEPHRRTLEDWFRPQSAPAPTLPLPMGEDGSDDERTPDPTSSIASVQGAPGHSAHPEADGPKSPAIQLHNSYLVAQSDDGLVIIDQHALHERIMYEDLRARLSRGPLEAQRLLIPMTLRASSRQIALLDQIQPLLEKLGIDVSAFGPDTVAVQSFPSFLDKLDPAVFVRELLERGEQELLDLHEEELLHEVLDMMACKAAIKAGDALTQPEIEALLARRELVERSSNCPHGRPTTLKLSLRDLEKQFKRTGF